MKADKQKKLIAAGWRIGDAKDFVGLFKSEAVCVETKLKTDGTAGARLQGICDGSNKQGLE